MEATRVQFTVGDASDKEYEAIVPPGDGVGFGAPNWQAWFALVDGAYWLTTTDGQQVQKRHIARVWRRP